MNAQYWPSPYTRPECRFCDYRTCINRGKFQRDRRDFSVTSGRCPRLPDKRGFVDERWRKDYEQTFPLLHCERDTSGELRLTVTIPGSPKLKIPKYHKRDHWWSAPAAAKDQREPFTLLLPYDLDTPDKLRTEMQQLGISSMLVRIEVQQ